MEVHQLCPSVHRYTDYNHKLRRTQGNQAWLYMYGWSLYSSHSCGIALVMSKMSCLSTGRTNQVASYNLEV